MGSAARRSRASSAWKQPSQQASARTGSQLQSGLKESAGKADVIIEAAVGQRNVEVEKEAEAVIACFLASLRPARLMQPPARHPPG